jgi:hypothetical protein
MEGENLVETLHAARRKYCAGQILKGNFFYMSRFLAIFGCKPAAARFHTAPSPYRPVCTDRQT